jgi:hypothetical protein
MKQRHPQLTRDVAGLCLFALVALLASLRATPADRSVVETPAEHKTDWWAFKPARRPAVPAIHSTVQRLNGSTNPIDLFIRAKLAELQLQPSAEADRSTLVRRLNYDLTGMPPTPEEVDAFLADHSPDTYERLVDRLLASPRYGERWARHWLDVVHFGETHGYDKDKLRPNAWPYRDYVIRAFNQDKPWSRFVEEQLAGDVLFLDDPDGIVALGFIAAGPWDFVGHVELPESKTDGLIARYNDRDDMVMTTFSAFQSLTVHCARCHDHKFDPITQKDYYSLQAVFAGVDRANRPFDLDPKVHRQRGTLMHERKTLEALQQELKAALAKVISPELAALDLQLAKLREKLGSGSSTNAPGKSPSNGYHSNIEPKPDVTKWVQVDLGRSRALDEIRLVPARPTDFPDTPGFGFPVRFKVEASNEDKFTNAHLVADHNTKDFKNPGDAPITFVVPPSGGQASHGAKPLEPPNAPPAEAGPTNRFIRITATRLWERTADYVFALAELQAFASGTNVARGATVTAHDSIEAGRWSMKNLVDGYSSRARLSDVALSPAEVAERRETETEVQQLATQRDGLFDSLVPVEMKSELARIQSRLKEVTNALAALPEPTLVYAAANEFKSEGSFAPAHGVRPVYLLQRGDIKQPRELVTPAALACMPGLDSKFDLHSDQIEGARRAALAKWLTNARNLQTRRSIVNRVWQYHFGLGLVDTPNDFGHMGSKPMHPELLDWLAFWFLDNGESLKKLHRLIVMSETYRQTSRNYDLRFTIYEPVGKARVNRKSDIVNRAEQQDGDNRFLWRQNRARLDAESIRDAMLFVSGQLDLTMGGPSDRQFYFKDDHSPVYDYTRFDVDSKEGRRRSIYRHIVRSVTDPFMDCLDAADPSQLVARRNTTLTALQALATLNNPFVLKQCEHFAARLQREANDLSGQIERAYRLALSRSPKAEEKKRLIHYTEAHGLTNACRVLFNSTEFVFVD